MNIIYYFLTTLLFLSCNEEKTKTVSFSSNQRDSSKIVLIFNSAPNMSNKQTIGGIRFIYTKEPTIKIWDNFKSQTIQPNIGHTDTIIIVPRGKLILLQHGYNMLLPIVRTGNCCFSDRLVALSTKYFWPPF